MTYVPDVASVACPSCWYPFDSEHEKRILPSGAVCDFDHGYATTADFHADVMATLGIRPDSMIANRDPISERERVG